MLFTHIHRTVLTQGRHVLQKHFSISHVQNSTEAFNVKMLDILVCPLSKAPLKFDPEKNELICEKLNVAYPIVDGIPNLIPQDARMINKSEE